MSLKPLLPIGVGVTAIGGGAYGLTQLLSQEDIASKLKARKYEILTEDPKHEEHWTSILESYKKVAATNSPLKFEGFNGENKSPEHPNAKDKLKELCKETISKAISEDDKEASYNKAKKWCVVPQTVSQRLTRDGLMSLNTSKAEASENLHKKQWEDKIADYIKSDNQHKITKPIWADDQQPKTSDPADIKKLIEQCKKLQETKTHQEDYETIFEDAKRWCAV